MIVGIILHLNLILDALAKRRADPGNVCVEWIFIALQGVAMFEICRESHSRCSEDYLHFFKVGTKNKDILQIML